MARDLVAVNAKMRRTLSVCGAAETLLIDRASARHAPEAGARPSCTTLGCEVRGDDEVAEASTPRQWLPPRQGLAHRVSWMPIISVANRSTASTAPSSTLRVTAAQHTESIVTDRRGDGASVSWARSTAPS
jgi:gamma-glutamyl phosphate reductase